MTLQGTRHFHYDDNSSYLRLIAGLLLLVPVLWFFPGQVYATDTDKDSLDASFSWTHKWEEEVGTGNIQEKGSCTIQVAGKIVRYQEDEEDDDSEFLRYIPQGLHATYTYNNTWHNIKPGNKCYGLIAEEKAIGSVEIGSVDEAFGPGDSMFELQALLGFGGQIFMMQWLATISPEKIMDIGKQPSSDNYTFKMIVPINTQIQAREECINLEPSLKRSFMFDMLIDEYDKKGMSGAFDHSATATTFQLLGYGSCCGVTLFLPSEGLYNITSNVSWTFGKVATLQILHWDNSTKKWVTVNNETIDVIAGEQIKLKAQVLPEEEGPLTKGQWTIDNGDNKNGKYIKKYDADFRKGEVLRLSAKELQQPEVTFYWTDEGKAKVSIKAMASNRPLAAETTFNIRKPRYNVSVSAAETSSIKEFTGFIPLDSSKCWVVEGPDTPGGTYFVYDGITFTPEPQDGITGKTQWVQMLESDYAYWIYQGGGGTKYVYKEVLDNCYPYPSQGKVAEDTPGMRFGIQGNPLIELDDNGNETGAELLEANKTQKNRMYLMFKPEGEQSEWIPLKVVQWTWSGSAWWEYGKSKTSGGNVTPENPQAEDTNQYPEWPEGMNAGNPAALQD